jgi:hypothetical protein
VNEEKGELNKKKEKPGGGEENKLKKISKKEG